MHVPANNQAITMCITWQACCRMYGHSKYPVVDAASSCSKQIQARLGLLWPPLGSLYMNDTRALADDCASELGTATVGSSWLEVSWMINSRHCSNEAYTPLGCSDQVPNLLGKLGFSDFCRSSHESASTASRWGSAALCQAPVKQRSLLSSQLLVCRWVFKAVVVVPMWVNPTLWCPAPHADERRTQNRSLATLLVWLSRMDRMEMHLLTVGFKISALWESATIPNPHHDAIDHVRTSTTTSG